MKIKIDLLRQLTGGRSLVSFVKLKTFILYIPQRTVLLLYFIVTPVSCWLCHQNIPNLLSMLKLTGHNCNDVRHCWCDLSNSLALKMSFLFQLLLICHINYKVTWHPLSPSHSFLACSVSYLLQNPKRFQATTDLVFSFHILDTLALALNTKYNL